MTRHHFCNLLATETSADAMRKETTQGVNTRRQGLLGAILPALYVTYIVFVAMDHREANKYITITE